MCPVPQGRAAQIMLTAHAKFTSGASQQPDSRSEAFGPFFPAEGSIWINQPKFVRLHGSVKREGGFGYSRRQGRKPCTRDSPLCHPPGPSCWSPAVHPSSLCVLSGPQVPCKPPSIPCRVSARGSTSGMETSLVHVLGSGESRVFLCHCLAHTVLMHL